MTIDSKPLEAYQYFPPNYATGRTWFQSSSKRAGGDLSTYVHPDETGPDGEELAIDMAWFGDPGAKKVFVSLSGTHGQEYFCGAAGQLNWICSNSPRQLPADTAVCLIHAVNPYGAAYLTRTNRDRIDLNRNFRDHSQPRPANEIFETVEAAITFEDLNELALYDLVSEFNSLLKRENALEVMTAIAGGQSTHPGGMAYCGLEHAWEVQTLLHIASTHLATATHVALIDWHTGLGPPGAASVLCELPKTSAAYDLSVKWWGEPPKSDALYDGGEEPQIEGEIRDGIAEAINAVTVQTVIELGTVDNRAIIPAFAIDRWLRNENLVWDSPEAIKWRTIMMERYNPSPPEWREKSLSEMARIYESTLRGLAEWG